MRESSVESYFTECIAKNFTPDRVDQRKYVSPGHRGVADRLVFLNMPCHLHTLHLVELKAPAKHLQEHQKRERERMKLLGIPTFRLDTHAKIDCYISMITQNMPYYRNNAADLAKILP